MALNEIYNHRRAPVQGKKTSGSVIAFRRRVCSRDTFVKASFALTICSFFLVNVYLVKREYPIQETASVDASVSNQFNPVPERQERLPASHVGRGLNSREVVQQQQPSFTSDNGRRPAPAALCGLPSACESTSLAFRLVVSRGSGDDVTLCFNGRPVRWGEYSGGVMVAAVAPSTLALQTRVFDTGSGESASDDLVAYLKAQPKDTILFMAANGERSTGLLSMAARQAIHDTGSGLIHSLDAKHLWGMATVKDLLLTTPHEGVSPPLLPDDDTDRVELSGCLAKSLYLSETNIMRRKVFCRDYGGTDPTRYGSFCSDFAISQYLLSSSGNNKGGDLAMSLPVTILARHDRPQYLRECLTSLFKNVGLKMELVTAYVDGYAKETHRLLNLFAVRSQFLPKTVSASTMKDVHKRADMITSHYGRVLPLAWAANPTARHMIVIEDDHTVSPDLLYFFSQLVPAVNADPSVFAVSAYNDNGYQHAAQDTGLVYRTEFFPGRVWLLPLRTWNSLKDTFPKCCGGWSWDLWMREPAVRKQRETLVPDVSRAHHIGEIGTQVFGSYWETYFKPNVLNEDASAAIRDVNVLTAAAYEKHLRDLIRSAQPLPATGSACGAEMVPDSSFGLRYVLYYSQKDATDFRQLQKLVKCFKLWDLGVRGLHKGLFRFHCKYNHIFLIGSHSEYGKTFKPAKTVPYTVT